MGVINVPLDFQNGSKKLFLVKAIFGIIWILFFFKMTSFSAFLCRKFCFFYSKVSIKENE